MQGNKIDIEACNLELWKELYSGKFFERIEKILNEILHENGTNRKKSLVCLRVLENV